MRLKSKQVLVLAILLQLSPSPDVIFLQETNLLPDSKFKITGYKEFYSDPCGSHDRGVMTFVKRRFDARKIGMVDVGHEVECLAVRLEIPRFTLILTNIYKHGELRLDCGKLFSLPDTVLQPDPSLPPGRVARSVIAGDVNAHHSRLGDTTDLPGRELMDALDESEYVLFNDDTPTHKSGTRIDWTITHQSIAALGTWKVFPDICSDHFATMVTFNLQPTPTPFRPPRRNLKKINWDGYTSRLERQFCDSDCAEDVGLSLEERVDRFNAAITDATDKTAPLTTGRHNPNNYYRWFMCPTVREALDRLRRFKRIQQISPSSKHKAALRKVDYETREILKHARSDHWFEWCCGLNAHTPLAEIWKQINRATGRARTAEPLHPFPQRKADQLIETFVARSDGSESTVKSKGILRRKAPERHKAFVEACRVPADTDRPYTADELASSLKRTRDTAPGSDGIRGSQLARLGPAARNELLNVYNTSHDEGRLPDQWREAQIVPIPKPKQADAFRPISLLSVPGKTMERMALARAEAACGPPPPQAFGFLRGLGTREALCALMTHLDGSYSRPKLVLFLDFNKAFETIDRLATLGILVKRGLRGKLLAWIGDYLYRRRAHVKFQGAKSGTHHFKKGTPQGGVMGPFLMNINVYEILDRKYPTGTYLVVYADDVILVVTGRHLYKRAQKCLDILGLAADDLGLKFGVPEKTEAMLVRGRRQPDQLLLIHDRPVTWVVHHQCLGVFVDRKLTFKAHIDYIKRRAWERLNAMRVLANCSQGATYTVLRTYYIMAIRSLVDYCAPVLAAVGPATVKPLQRIQNAACRQILGAPVWTRVETMEAELGLEPIDLRLTNRQVAAAITVLKRGTRLLYDKYRVLFSRDRSTWKQDCWGLRLGDKVREFTKFPELLQHGPDTDQHRDWPPWEGVRASFWCDPYCEGRKSDADLRLLRARAENRVRVLSQDCYCTYFTDGSVTDQGKGGYGVVLFPDYNGNAMSYEALAGKTTDNPSTMQTELAAIRVALDHAVDTAIFRRERGDLVPRRLAIFSDSLSGLSAIQNIRPTDNVQLLTGVHVRLKQLYELETSVVMAYVPSHVGLRGNELADQQAALGTWNPTNPDKCFTMPPSLGQLKRRLRAKTQDAAAERRALLRDSSDSIRWHCTAMTDLPPIPPSYHDKTRSDCTDSDLGIDATGKSDYGWTKTARAANGRRTSPFSITCSNATGPRTPLDLGTRRTARTRTSWLPTSFNRLTNVITPNS